MHVDMDAFYASVEQRRRPELAHVPMWVGGDRRGVVLSANYLARRWGVQGGMPSSRARRLCPQGVAVRPDFEAYTQVSDGIVAVLQTVTARVESASIDEAYLDLTGSWRHWGSARAAGEHLRALVYDEQRITCSVGIGPNRLIAKMASVAAKPDGLVEVSPQEVVGFLTPLPVERLVGVGESTAARLHRLGIHTVGELAARPRVELQRSFGRRAGGLLSDLANGNDSSRVIARPGERGVGNQETFGADTADPATIRAELLRLALKVGARLRAAGLVARNLTVHLRYADFVTTSAATTLREPTAATDDLHEAAVALYTRLNRARRPVRRVGLRAHGLVGMGAVHAQPALDDPEHGWDDAERAADAVIARFGPHSVQRAALTGRRRP